MRDKYILESCQTIEDVQRVLDEYEEFSRNRERFVTVVLKLFRNFFSNPKIEQAAQDVIDDNFVSLNKLIDENFPDVGAVEAELIKATARLLTFYNQFQTIWEKQLVVIL